MKLIIGHNKIKKKENGAHIGNKNNLLLLEFGCVPVMPIRFHKINFI
jgi:hypothetical protein